MKACIYCGVDCAEYDPEHSPECPFTTDLGAVDRFTDYSIELGLGDGWLVLESGWLTADSAERCADDYRRHEFPDKTIRVVKKTVTWETI